MKHTVREASKTDAFDIRDVHIASIRELGRQSYDEKQVEAWAHPRDPDTYPIQSKDTYFLVAELDEQVIGFGWMKPDADDYFQTMVESEITAIYIHPSVALEGVGSNIYRRLEENARQRGITSLGLWSSLNAVPFYQAQGYSHATEHTHEFHDGVEGIVIEMRKELV